VPASSEPPTDVSAITTAAPSTPAAETPGPVDGPTGETAFVCGYVEPDPSVVPLAASCAQGYLLTSYYRPAGATYGARLWGLEGNAWVLRAKFVTGCPRASELAAKGLPASLAEAWGSEGGCRSDGEPFPFPDAVAVPQLGDEPVRGSGCGADGSIGDRLPDGTWSVRALRSDGQTLDVDITCIFYGDEALQRSAAAGALPNDLWYEVNGSDRSRSITLAPRFQLRYASRGEVDFTCVDSGRPARFTESNLWNEIPGWLVVRDGEAQLLLITCPFG
jgi:hypothetical protein